MGFWDQPAGSFPAALAQDGVLARALASLYGNRIIPMNRGTAEEAGSALYGMTGLPDVQAGAQAMGRGEYLPGFGQMAFGFGSLGALGAPVARGAMTAGREALGAVPGVLADTRGAIRAFHGSPHDFDRFDMSKIGTGEGAQAYGHGLYFAGNEATARSYRDALSRTLTGAPGYDLATNTLSATTLKNNTRVPANIDEAIKVLQSDVAMYDKKGWPYPEYKDQYDTAISHLEEWKDTGMPSPGRMYEARINAEPEHFLDWDKPLSQQSEAVRAAIRPTYGEVTTRPFGENPNFGPMADLLVNGQSVGAFPASALEGKDLTAVAMRHDPRTGAAIYQHFANDLRIGSQTASGGKIEAAEALREAGIPGIRYLDQGSRGAGEGTSNYVVFDDKLIDIIRKYGLAGLIAGGTGAIPGMGER